MRSLRANKIYAILEQYRTNYIEGSKELCVDLKTNIDGTNFKKNVWIDSSISEKGNLIVFMLSSKKLFFLSSHYCLGLIEAEDKEHLKLSNEELWEIGIP